ncbi:hypothetical protein [Wolbachia endosymbiont of Pentidionis agamae]|uniref:hypothetical protein n=1 Tax=Wolbachia endosymbiont of Pentidionis agamae TaxID=3110435 RepID=UPI002FD721D2
MEDINNNFSALDGSTAVQDFFRNNGVGDYSIQCDYGGMPYSTNEHIHAGNKFWSNDFLDSHGGKEIKMYPQSEILAKEYAGNKLPISISLDKDLVKIKECQKEEHDNKKKVKCYTTKLPYGNNNVHVYDDKDSTLKIKYDVPHDPKYSLDITLTKVNDNKPGFFQKLKNLF